MSSQNNSTTWRNGYKWTVNECLRLEREYDLLQLSVSEMALLHNRTKNAIMFKLHQEGLADYNELYIQTYGNSSITNDVTYPSLLQVDVSVNEDEDYDEEYVPKLIDEDEDEDDDEMNDSISDIEHEDVNEYYLAEQIRSLQKQINSLMSYFTKRKSVSHLQHTA